MQLRIGQFSSEIAWKNVDSLDILVSSYEIQFFFHSNPSFRANGSLQNIFPAKRCLQIMSRNNSCARSSATSTRKQTSSKFNERWFQMFIFITHLVWITVCESNSHYRTHFHAHTSLLYVRVDLAPRPTPSPFSLVSVAGIVCTFDRRNKQTKLEKKPAAVMEWRCSYQQFIYNILFCELFHSERDRQTQARSATIHRRCWTAFFIIIICCVCVLHGHQTPSPRGCINIVSAGRSISTSQQKSYNIVFFFRWCLSKPTGTNMDSGNALPYVCLFFIIFSRSGLPSLSLYPLLREQWDHIVKHHPKVFYFWFSGWCRECKWMKKYAPAAEKNYAKASAHQTIATNHR